jgi:endonuclease G, mitochondrial
MHQADFWPNFGWNPQAAIIIETSVMGCCPALIFMPAKPRWITTALILGLLMTMVLGCGWWFNRSPQPAPTPVATFGPAQATNHLRFGNPSQATKNAQTNGNNFLIERPQYALSYNNAKLTPNWVSWQLNPTWIGTTPRTDNFRPDPSLPANWYKVTPADYSKSGYDRGHMTPAADRDSTPENASATYFMTNIVPQSPDNNRGPWVKLEEYCRKQVERGKELQIIAGVYGNQGTIGKTKPITVPATVWKAVLIMSPGQSPRDIGPRHQIIAVEIPNEPGIKTAGWGKYRVTVDSIEQKTGYDLFSNIPVDVQAQIESRISP